MFLLVLMQLIQLQRHQKKHNMIPRVLIGLGNPDAKFSHTRHNAGFKVVDAVATLYGGRWQFSHDKAVATIRINGQPVILIKPLTYMNNSGEVVPFIKTKGIAASESLVIHDELDKHLGHVSFRQGGSARGHNGLKSLITYWGTNEFPRLRFGIGRPDNKEQVPHYVLQRFDDLDTVNQSVHEAVSLIDELYENEEAA